MHARWKIYLGGFILTLMLATSAAARTYASYYTCLSGSITAVVVTNASAFEHEQAFNLSLYDAEGTLVHSVVSDLGPYESVVYFLNDLIEQPGELSWGSLVIESNVLLLAGVWIGTETDWFSITNIQAQTLSTDGLAIAYYWYGANYANTENRRTGIAVINPGESMVTGTAFVYDSAGALQNSSDFTLPPHGSAFFRPESVFPIGDNSWGLIDIRSTDPIVVASEYYDGDGTLLDVDIIDRVYYLQTEQNNSGD